MYKEFDDYLSGYFHDDYWYNEGFVIAREIIEKFQKSDWELLLKEIDNKELDWKKRLAYCIDNRDNPYELKILLRLFESDDDELLKLTIDSLRLFDNETSKALILKNTLLRKKLNYLMNNSSDITKIMLKDYLKKMNISL